MKNLETMPKKLETVPLLIIIVMAGLSFTNLVGLRIAGAAVVLGVAFFFIAKAYEKQSSTDSGLDIQTIKDSFKERRIWLWIALPLIMDAVSITASKLFLPEYIEHVLARTEIFVSFDKVAVMVFQLAFLALGEEIAWRAFFQNRLSKALPIVPALVISSALFAIGHVSPGSTNIVLYDISFVFINSILYGVIFYKTNNAWVSALSHFIANLFGIIVLVLL